MIAHRFAKVVARGLATKQVSEPKFSKSAAFMGRGRTVQSSQFQLDYYATDEFANKKIISALLSLTALVAYFGWLREPSDLDEVWSTPPHILTANLERKMLRNQIKEAEAKGQSTEYLQAQLEYVDVKEEALKIQFQDKSKKVGSV
ncbi:unnamed protein product [Auanema sp. JU1783]|nr:unnamed protein product [Auanema sp. JU1783]